MNRLIKTVSGMAVSVLLISNVVGQQAELTPLTGALLMQRVVPASPVVQLRFINPGQASDSFFGSREESINSGSYRLSGLIPVGENSAIEIILPYQVRNTTYISSFFGESFTSETKASDIGNISVTYIKETNSKNSNLTNYLSLGVVLPTAGEDSWQGVFDNYYDFPAYTDEWMTFKGLFSIVKAGSRSVVIVEGGVDSWIHVGDEDEDVEFMGRYGVGYSFLPNENISLHAEFVGYGILSEEDIGDGSRFQHQLAVGARYQIGKFVPGIFYMKNFNDLGDVIPDGVAIELSMTL